VFDSLEANFDLTTFQHPVILKLDPCFLKGPNGATLFLGGSVGATLFF
jgi:hypothetical protein